MRGRTEASARPVVHIGYHKTATTWFQKAFYPQVRGGRCVARRSIRQALLEPRGLAFDARAAHTLLDGDGRLLLCEENLSGYPHNGGLGGLVTKMAAERIKAVLPDAQIVVFLREQVAAIAAAYAQYVRSGGTRAAAEYVGAQTAYDGARSHWYKAPLFDHGYFDYGPTLDLYAELFGRQSVHVFLFEDFAADPIAFLERFVRRLDLDVELGELDLTPRNRSLSPRGLAVMRRLNLFTPKSVLDKTCLLPLPGWYDRRWRLARALLGQQLEASAPAEARLGPAMAKELRSRYGAANDRLASEWGLSLARYGYAGGAVTTSG